MRRLAPLLAVSLSVATAAGQPWSPPPVPNVSRYEEPVRARSPDGERWQPLVVRPTSRPDLDTIVFRGRGGRLSWLLIDPVHAIGRVVVVYADRPPQVVRGGWLRRSAGLVEIDRGARVTRIDLYNRRPHDRPYAVFAG